jgi:hypothetical protein
MHRNIISMLLIGWSKICTYGIEPSSYTLTTLMPKAFCPLLQSRKTKRQASQNSVEKRNDTHQRNIQNRLHRQDQQA